MKCTIPEISWHNRDPVYSIDVQPGTVSTTDKETVYRVASGGTDCHVLIWFMKVANDGTVTVEFASDLHKHQRAVNVVRFSPSGSILASGDDESVVMLWRQKSNNQDVAAPDLWDENQESDGTETWQVTKILRGHMEDIYDLSWSPDSNFLVSGSVDNSAIVWDVNKGQKDSILKDHKGFVQGVAWDPKNKYIATLSSDRICRIFGVKNKKIVSRISKSWLPLPGLKSSVEDEKTFRLFHDDTFKSFFRRLSFTPCGELLITPSGCIETESNESSLAEDRGKCNASYIFTRHTLNKPVVYLPTGENYTVAVRCCPVLFELRSDCPLQEDGTNSLIPLPYRCIFAVATQDSVVLYDTQQEVPIGLVSNIHYTRLSDISWSSDGLFLIVSSTDGYCSMVTFTPGELGTPYEEASIESEESETTLNTSCDDEDDFKLILEDTTQMELPSTESVATEQNATAVPENIKFMSPKKSEEAKLVLTPVKSTSVDSSSPNQKKALKRVQLITLSSPKKCKKGVD